MIRAAEIPVLTGEVAAEPSGKRSYGRYLWAVCLVPFVGYLLMFPLVMFPALGFDRWGGSKWAPVLDYGYRARQVNADVVIFGDSSAFLDVDPRLVDKELGTHSIVLPNTFGSLQVTGDMVLRRYLAANAPPRLIVFYFTPWDLNFEHISRPQFIFEGEEMLLRNGSPRDIARFALRHPRTFLRFPLQLNALLDLHDVRLALATDRAQQTAEAHGHMDYTDPIGPLPSHCQLPAEFLKPPDRAKFSALVERYETPQTRVLIYFAPVPACANANQLTQEVGAGLAPPPAPLPPEWFASDALYAHVLPPHVAISTKLLTDALRSSGVGDHATTAVPAAQQAYSMSRSPGM